MAQLVVNFAENQLSLHHRGVNLIDGISAETKASYLALANTWLEEDIDRCVEGIKELEDGHFLWIVTWYPIRLDDLQGMIAWYYITVIIKDLVVDNDFSSISLSDHFPNYFRKHLEEQVGIPTNRLHKPISSLKKKLRENVSPFRILYNIFQHRNGEIKIAKGDLWLVTDANFKLHRYRSFLSYLKGNRKAFFHNHHTINISNRMEGDENLNFSSFFRLNDLLAISKRSYILRSKAKRIKSPHLVAQFFKHINYSQLSIMMLREILVDRAMAFYPPKAIFLTTANTHPPARLVTRLANLHGISSVIVACRPMFTDLRPEERTCVSDLTMVHDAKISDYIVVWDLFSKNTLIGQNIPEGRIFVQQNHPTNLVKHFTLESTLLILFSDTESNEKLIAQLERLRGCINLSVAIKTHPVVKLTQDQMERLTKLFPYFIDVSTYKMHDIKFKDVVAMCISTSAGVEAVSYGCGIIWLPYLNERAIVFYSVMKVLGWNFSNQGDLFEALSHLSSDALVRQDFINECQESYHKHFVTTDNVQDLLPLLKL